MPYEMPTHKSSLERIGFVLFKSRVYSLPYAPLPNWLGARAFQAFAQAKKAIGWGIFEFQEVNFERLSGTVIVRDSFEAASWGKKNYAVCDWTRGAIAGFMSVVFGKLVKVKEVKCLAIGADVCEFVIRQN